MVSCLEYSLMHILYLYKIWRLIEIVPCYFEFEQKRHLYLPSGPGMLTEAPPLSKSCAVETMPKRIDSCKGDSIL